MTALGSIRLDHYRKPFTQSIDALAPHERQQLEQLVREESGLALEKVFDPSFEDEEAPWPQLELCDVIDTKSGEPVFQLYLWPFGSGAIFRAGSLDLVANVCQHGLDGVDPAAASALGDLPQAFAEGKKRLGIAESIHF